MPALNSSNLASAEWEAPGMLFVTFKSGSTYRYDGVEQEVYQGLLSAPSPGAYFASVIKNAYQTTRIS